MRRRLTLPFKGQEAALAQTRPRGIEGLFADGYVGPQAAAAPGQNAGAAAEPPAAFAQWLGAIQRMLAQLFADPGSANPQRSTAAVDEFAPAQPQGEVGPRPRDSQTEVPAQPTRPAPGREPPRASSTPGTPGGAEVPTPRPEVSTSGPKPRPGLEVAPQPSAGERGRTWDVFFDAKEGTRTRQQSPVVLDLNGNGKPDITGKNIKGDGKINGGVEGFDLNPSKRQWENRSVMRRPGRGAPSLPKGARMEIYDKKGKLRSSQKASDKDAQSVKLQKGERAEFRDKDGKLVGELRQQSEPRQGLLPGMVNDGNQYYWGNKNANEWTKPWDKDKGGDGLLAWDLDRDGKITSGKELFGHVDTDGQNRFKNGYEKLAAHFDKDGNGVVEGGELAGLKIWEDRNGDGVTQDGELVDLAERGVTSLDTAFDPANMSSRFGRG